MRIAVTGATGFLGRYIVNHLTDREHTCQCWYRPQSVREGFGRDSSIRWVPGQLGDDESAERIVDGCDAIVHAALHRSGRSFQGGEGSIMSFAEKNVLGTLRLIEAARQAGVERFIFLATCAVHDNILDDRPLDEKHPLWPRTHYGAHKAALEKFVHSYGYGDGYSICSLRPTGIYGVNRPATNSKWYDLVSRIVRGDDTKCARGGKEVHAADVARAVEILLKAENIAGEAYSCYDMYISEFDVAHLARRIAKSKARILGEQMQPKHQIHTGKIRSLGMEFGGHRILEETVTQLVKAARN